MWQQCGWGGGGRRGAANGHLLALEKATSAQGGRGWPKTSPPPLHVPWFVAPHNFPIDPAVSFADFQILGVNWGAVISSDLSLTANAALTMNPYTFDLRTHASWLKGQIHDASCAGPIVRHIVSVTVLMLCLGAVAVVYTYRDLHWRELSWQRADGLLKGQPCGNVNEVKDAASIQVPEATVSAWKAAAATNLTEFEASLAARMRPLKRNKNYWPHFPPVISCPPDRPLTRYGGCGDGSKLLCRLPTTLRDGHPCVIYSLGSNGEFVLGTNWIGIQ